LIALLLIGPASAEANLVYIVRDIEYPEPAVISALDELGISYEVVEDDFVPETNFMDYEVILVWNEPLENYENIPITIRKSVVASEHYLETWGIGEYAGQSISTGYLDAETYSDNKITEGIMGVFKAYDETNVIMNWLSYKPKRAPGLKKAIVTTNVQQYPVVGYINPGAMLYSGGFAQERTAFFGITSADSWTPESEQIFKNTIEWALYGDDADRDGFYSDEDCDDENPLINPDAEEIPYNGIDEDCSGADLTDIDEDGYDSWEAGGNDCDDENPLINPGSEDIFMNCINDPPVIEPIAPITVTEGEEVIIEVDAWDAELDSLTYSINDSRFSQNENNFVWETDFDDEGTYYFTVSVEDGEYASEQEAEVEVEHKNQKPVCSTIEKAEWDEDELGTLDLKDYCQDGDGDALIFGIRETSDSTSIELESFEEGEAVFRPEEDWWGEDWIVFYASDGKAETATNKIRLIVNPVNDAPAFQGKIEDITWEEDTSLFNHINLADYFSDDNEASYSAEGNNFIDIQIVEGLVTFTPDEDWFGSEEVVFSAYDGEFTTYSNQLTLTVTDKNEEPEFLELSCQTSILEDEEYNCTLRAVDEEQDDFEFSVAGEDNLKCEIEGNELNYKSYQDYFGEANCILRVSDESGHSELEFAVSIEGVNDAPRIFPDPEGNVRIVEGNTQLFEINVEEVDGDDYEISWKLEGEEAGDREGYLFNQPKGNYALEAAVSDGKEQSEYQWNVRVGDISEFTCSEVQGYECEKGELCYRKDILDVLGSGTCCSVPCQPELRELERCENLDERIEITIKKPDTGEKFMIGEEIEVRVKIENKLDENTDAEITAYFYDLSDEEVIDEDDEDIYLKDRESREVEFRFEVKNRLDDSNNYVIFVKAEDEHCNEKMIEVDIEREEDDVVIKGIEYSENAECREEMDFIVKAVNRGARDQDVVIKVESSELGFSEESDEFELEEYGGEDSETRKFVINIPEDAEGEYKITTNILFNGKKRVNEQIVSVKCEKTGEESQEEIQSISLGTKQELKEQTGGSDNAGKALLLITIATTIIVVLVIVYLIYFLFKN
jgi:hypothetical protein